MSLFPMTFPKCQVCGYDKTVAQLVAQEEGVSDGPETPATNAFFTPLPSQVKLATPIVKGILTIHDICARCGLQRCIRAEIRDIPAAQLPIFGQPPRPVRPAG